MLAVCIQACKYILMLEKHLDTTFIMRTQTSYGAMLTGSVIKWWLYVHLYYYQTTPISRSPCLVSEYSFRSSDRSNTFFQPVTVDTHRNRPPTDHKKRKRANKKILAMPIPITVESIRCPPLENLHLKQILPTPRQNSTRSHSSCDAAEENGPEGHKSKT